MGGLPPPQPKAAQAWGTKFGLRAGPGLRSGFWAGPAWPYMIELMSTSPPLGPGKDTQSKSRAGSGPGPSTSQAQAQAQYPTKPVTTPRGLSPHSNLSQAQATLTS
ncbi:hypothetical protein AMTR_s00057p00218690 [Amborella trichopoda]|uniref:Uncharacterized protein n=1 Tax=Amborella trichopoda TaxID=13333 RepID=U5CUQ5_AMBTC|nr:hypothetical protein AMTR_s00057p00218690 [Amborella trichopoda]